MYKFKPLKIAVLIAGFTFLETGFLSDFPYHAKIELLLMLVVFLGVFSFKKQLYISAFLCGLIKDIFSLLPFGAYALMFMLAAFLTSNFSKKIFEINKLIFGLLIFIFSFFLACSALFLSGEMFVCGFAEVVFKLLFPAAFISALLSPLVFSFFEIILVENENKPC